MTNCFIEIDKQFEIKIELFDTSVTKKFLEQLKWHLSNSSINHYESFYGYAEESFVKQNLLNSIQIINRFLKKDYINLPTNINWDDNNFYNDLHKYFENLNGDWGKPTLLLQICPHDVKQAIRNLNFSIHRLERRPYKKDRTLYLSWDKNTYSRMPLDKDDYQYFVEDYNENYVYLSYVEVGKHLKELFNDNLHPTYEAYKNLHYVSAEINIHWEIPKEPLFSDEFKEWAKQYNIDYTDKTLGIGLMPIGTFIGSDKNFTKDSKITNIIIKE